MARAVFRYVPPVVFVFAGLMWAALRGTRYSPLDQINSSNFNSLHVAWRFKTDIAYRCRTKTPEVV